MLLRWTYALALLGCFAACAPRPDPRLKAAEDFRDTAYDLIHRDETQTKKLTGLRLGMTDTEVLEHAGPPSLRKTSRTDDGGRREVWTYGGALKELGTLVFEEQRLVEINVQ